MVLTTLILPMLNSLSTLAGDRTLLPYSTSVWIVVLVLLIEVAVKEHVVEQKYQFNYETISYLKKN